MKQNLISYIGLAALIVLVLGAFSSAFVIPEGRQAVVTQFGKPVRTVREAGLHFKMPFIQDVRTVDLRILSWDGYPNQIPTKDKKYIEVDTTARWKIVDPLKFIQTVQNERGARTRLDAILDGITRDVISNHRLVEAVRNSNTILDVIEEKKQEAKALAQDQEQSQDDESIEAEAQKKIEVAVAEEEVASDIEPIEIGREQLSQFIVNKARSELEPLGVEIIDVQLKRITYEESVQKKVYSRMISERQRIAEKIRSYGKGQQAKIQGKTQRDLERIQSEAYRKVQSIKGQADAKAIAIYAQAMGRDPEFYSFLRNLEAYDKALSKDSRFLLSTDSRFWQVLDRGK